MCTLCLIGVCWYEVCMYVCVEVYVSVGWYSFRKYVSYRQIFVYQSNIICKYWKTGIALGYFMEETVRCLQIMTRMSCQIYVDIDEFRYPI